MSRKQPPAVTDFPHHWHTTTRWDDNDVYGHLNNVVYYRLFDTAVNRFLLDNGLLDFRTGKNVYLVVETGCSYFAELAYPDKLIVGLRVARLGTSSVTYETGLFRDGEAAAAAAGHFVHVLVDKASRKPVPIEANSRTAFETLMM
ncbi:putative thioesterase [SAR116 cluster alpha proteobacterium HIMB100]|nr:putative thioesterase [SAR116 cluster alpha proteobacterium HIMB100]